MLLLQGRPDVTASVDRTNVAVGDVIVCTIRVNAVGSEPVELSEPLLSGLMVVGSRDMSQVTLTAGAPQRVTTRELRLRAIRAGTATIGIVRAQQGTLTAQTDQITVHVVTSGAAVDETLDPRIKTLLEHASPPTDVSDVAVTVLPLRDTVVVGDQLDVVVAAWFPRELRRRLRSPPVITPPEIQGGWTYQQTAPTGIVASRLVHGQWLDLFINDQVVFPLAAGRVVVGRATVAYSFPLTYSFLSRELRHEVQSDSLSVAVLPQPAAGRPADFPGGAGADMALAFDATPREVAAGEPMQVTATLSGQGNVALWPEPAVRWPEGTRVYPGDVTVALEPRQGRIAGSKTFHYLLVADSVGTYTVPPPDFPYFDLRARRYADARAPNLRLVVHAGNVGGSRAAPPPLLPFTRPSPILTVVSGIPYGAWIALLVLPPLLTLLVRRTRRVRAPAPASAAAPRRRRSSARIKPGSLEQLHQEFRVTLTRLVPDADLRDGDGLVDALRAAGIEAQVAAHATRIRDRLRHAVYGEGGASDPAELVAEVRGVLEAMLGTAAAVGRRGTTLAVVAALALIGWSRSAAGLAVPLQVSAERLYDIGAYKAAADSFAARAAAEPGVSAHWFNLGEAEYRLGDDGRARAAWIKAARLAPRDPLVRRAMTLVPAPDGLSDQLAPVAPVTPDEAIAIAVAAWLLGWTLLLLRLPRRHAWPAFLVALVAAGYAGYVADAYARPVGIVLDLETPLRTAAYGTATAQSYLPSGSAVVITRENGAWLLVRRDGAQGWMLRSEVEPL